MKLMEYRLMRTLSELHRMLRDKYIVEGEMIDLDANMIADLDDLVAKIEAIKVKVQE